jgi:hypothetical protein
VSVVLADDPWYDYLAVPVAPLVLAAQLAALFLRRASLRRLSLIGAPVLIGAMFAYLVSRPIRADEGVPIGQGVLLLWLLVSLILSLVGLAAEGARSVAVRRERRRTQR